MSVSNINIPGITKTEQIAMRSDEVSDLITKLSHDDNPKLRHDCHGAMLRAGITDSRRREQLMVTWAQRAKRNRGDE
jgi:hypothetical protein